MVTKNNKNPITKVVSRNVSKNTIKTKLITKSNKKNTSTPVKSLRKTTPIAKSVKSTKSIVDNNKNPTKQETKYYLPERAITFPPDKVRYLLTPRSRRDVRFDYPYRGFQTEPKPSKVTSQKQEVIKKPSTIAKKLATPAKVKKSERVKTIPTKPVKKSTPVTKPNLIAMKNKKPARQENKRLTSKEVFKKDTKSGHSVAFLGIKDGKKVYRLTTHELPPTREIFTIPIKKEIIKKPSNKKGILSPVQPVNLRINKSTFKENDIGFSYSANSKFVSEIVGLCEKYNVENNDIKLWEEIFKNTAQINSNAEILKDFCNNPENTLAKINKITAIPPKLLLQELLVLNKYDRDRILLQTKYTNKYLTWQDLNSYILTNGDDPILYIINQFLIDNK